MLKGLPKPPIEIWSTKEANTGHRKCRRHSDCIDLFFPELQTDSSRKISDRQGLGNQFYDLDTAFPSPNDCVGVGRPDALHWCMAVPSLVG